MMPICQTQDESAAHMVQHVAHARRKCVRGLSASALALGLEADYDALLRVLAHKAIAGPRADGFQHAHLHRRACLARARL